MTTILEAKQVTDLLDRDPKDAMMIPYSEYYPLQLATLKKRFNNLMPKIKVLNRAAVDKGISEINSEKDIVPLLFAHSTYKIYSETYISDNKWDKMNNWLSSLSTYDFTQVDVTGVKSIDGWLDCLDEAGFFVTHSSGTGGKPSFLPKAPEEFELFDKIIYHLGIAGYEIKKEEMGTIPVLMLLFKEGRTAMIRGLNKFATILAPEGQIHYAMPGIMSADRQRSQALTRKQLREGSISGLKKMKAKAMTGIGNKVLGKWMKNFIEDAVEKYRDQRIFFFGPEPLAAKLALTYLPKGYNNLFAPDSIISIGGGLKGAQLPPNHKEAICKFFGVRPENLLDGYGMTEKNPMPVNHKGKWILSPWEIPILLDEDTGEFIEMDPTSDKKYTGQYAFFDTTALSYWGGIITGDRVTIDWSNWEGKEYAGPTISVEGRITDLEGIDADKLSCSATFEDYFEEEGGLEEF
ncbi:MAG: hypothetical protein HeimC3_33720 [Candidatus Heimdallarchaeota archaeon LC_3]|nr:MAG: hypothetical protein HeimC3_33720 [Candidatus Heimdallarchaeota archaeon LC_3]